MPKKIREPIHFFNRYTQQLESEAVYGEPWLRWAYETRIGKRTTKLILKRAWFSAWYGWRMDSSASRKKIMPFISKYNINLEELANHPSEYISFNDFFYRHLKNGARPIDTSTQSAIFPADGRHFGFQNISNISSIFVKGQQFDLNSFLMNPKLAERYQHGSLVISRLCPVDYHRFHFPVNGVPRVPRFLHGDLLSVNPIALRKNISIFWQNRRVFTEILTKEFGHVLMAEIGATCVGHIIQTFKPNHTTKKGNEKGFFKFGGSSTVLLFEPNRIQLAKDLVEQTNKGYELYARMGDILGTANEPITR